MATKLCCLESLTRNPSAEALPASEGKLKVLKLPSEGLSSSAH